MSIENRLILLKTTTSNTKGAMLGLYKCSCGKATIKELIISRVKNNEIRSCGCLQLESATKHGMYNTTEWRIWSGMRARCNNKKHREYNSYGGRGILVCQLWEYSFDDFYMDMGPRPSLKHTLDRIDNDKGYYPKNCRWATQLVQHNNKRSNTIITFRGQTLTLTQWSRKLDIKISTLINRLKKLSVEEAFTLPIQKPFGNP